MTNEQTNKQIPDWLKLENQVLQENKPTLDDREALKFTEGEIVSFEIDFSEPFDKWIDPDEEKVIKKIIPVIHNDIEKVLWINVRNPLYSELVEKGVEGITKFSVLQTGTKQKTRYSLV